MFEFEQTLKGITILVLVILLLGLLIRKLNQPYFVAYIIAGVFLGPFGIRLFD
jgi:monovalent cation:H+ antiporter-2, CPA2 family